MDAEAAQAALAELGLEGWEGPVQEALNGAKWQDKVEALEAMGRAVAEKQLGGRLSGALVCFLSTKTSGFRVSNVNILKAAVQCACSAVQNVGAGEGDRFSRSAAWELLKGLGDKLGDKKTKEPLEALLSGLCEARGVGGPSFVVRRMKVYAFF